MDPVARYTFRSKDLSFGNILTLLGGPLIMTSLISNSYAEILDSAEMGRKR